jgi:hypothetical protein
MRLGQPTAMQPAWRRLREMQPPKPQALAMS